MDLRPAISHLFFIELLLCLPSKHDYFLILKILHNSCIIREHETSVETFRRFAFTVQVVNLNFSRWGNATSV